MRDASAENASGSQNYEGLTMETTDRELLEAAARAAGMNTRDLGDDRGLYVVGGSGLPWNPLHDDGDALRLAVKLRLDIWNQGFEVRILGEKLNARINEASTMGYDLETATRRAIVRAAASIGSAGAKGAA